MDFEKVSSRHYFLFVGLFLILLFSFLKPEGTTALHPVLQLLQWTLQVAIPLILIIFIQILLARMHQFDALNPWFQLSISGFLGCLLFSPIALTLDFVFENDSWPAVSTSRELAWLWFDELLGITPPIVLVWLGINAPRVLGLNFSQSAVMDIRQVDQTQVQPQENQSNQTGFYSLLPARIGSDIIFLAAELHYIRVVTTLGHSLVLYNLRDAISELGENNGIQTHRSYWVSYAHIDRLISQPSPQVQMDNGERVPVSRRKLSEVKKRTGL